MSVITRTTTLPWRALTRLFGERPRPRHPAPRAHRRSAGSVRIAHTTAGELNERAPLSITRGALEELRSTVGALPPETGGLLGGSRRTGIITDFYFDETATISGATYSPDVELLNRMLKEEWGPAGVELLGFVHSHPSGSTRPSYGDEQYASRILEAITDLNQMAMPIVQSAHGDHHFSMRSFVAEPAARQSCTVTEVETLVLPTEHESASTFEHFDRVQKSYDLELMAKTRVVIAGVGGAAAYAEGLARAGVGEFVLIDPDIVEAPNIGTQQVYLRDLGRSKAKAVADRILAVSPFATVTTITDRIEALDDVGLNRVLHGALPSTRGAGPASTLLCGFTDSFEAQAAVNKIAVQFQVPMIAAQVYQEGRGVEVSFSAPGLTPACGRCVLGGRYRAWEQGGFENDVTSHGTPLWATDWLNALKTKVTMALLHSDPAADPEHPATIRYRSLAQRIATKNLVITRLDPDLALPQFDQVFADADNERLVSGETLWLPQEPENEATGFEPCADCGGHGYAVSAMVK